MKPASNDLVPHAVRLTRLYILALAAVACLSILGQVLVQYALGRQLSDSTVVNLAGRQRMLSQQLTKAALALERSATNAERARWQAEVADVLSQWRRADAGLRRGSSDLGLPGGNSPAVEQLLVEIEPHLAAMSWAAEAIASDPSQSSAATTTLLAHEPEFLAGMDAIVRQYEQEARERVRWLRSVEQVLLGLTLLVLACEGAFIFRPAVRRIRAAALAMLESREQLQLAKQQAESANEAKSQFLGMISHELRNPLQAVLGSVELARRTQADADRALHLDTIDSAARTLLVMLNDLLDLARIEAGKLHIALVPIDPLKLTERTLAMVRPQAQDKGIELLGELPTQAPNGLLGDDIRLQQILLNLCGNAFKFTQRGSITVRLAIVEESATAVRLRWEVTDTGVGIAPENQSEVFEAFTQLPGARAPRSGAGLGLAICRRLVQLMQGEIGVSSEPGKGSTFWFELPLEKCESTAAVSADVHVARLPQAFQVLVVDDDSINRRLLAQLLEVLGVRAVAADDGRAALARVRFEPFDIVFIDWQMPGMNGGELSAAIRALETELGRSPATLIALSAAVERANQGCDPATFDQWLMKPIGLSQLREAIALATPAGISDAPQQSAEPEEGSRWTTVLARLGGRRELLGQLAAGFTANLPALLTQLGSALEEQNLCEVSRLAHLLVGQASNFEAIKLVAAARDVEDQASQGLSQIDLTRLTAACEQLIVELEPWSLVASANYDAI